MSDIEKGKLEREIMLRSAFPALPERAYARFVEVMQPSEAEAGRVLYSVGDASDRVYFLTQGRAALEVEGEEPWFFDPVSVLGVFDTTLERPRRRACRVLEPSKLFVVRSSEWFEMLDDDAQIARAVIHNFATGLERRWRALVNKTARESRPPSGPVPTRLEHFDKLLALRRAAFVKRAGMQALVNLANVAESVSVRADEQVFRSSDDHDQLWVVASGIIELSQGNDFCVHHGAGDLIGGPGALAKTLSGATARGVTNAALVRISDQDFYDRAEEHPRLTRGVLAYLVTELEEIMHHGETSS